MKLDVPGLLVEYMINGVCALIWISQLIKDIDIAISLIYLAPGVYVVGMFIDFIAFSLLVWPKRAIRYRALHKRGHTHKPQTGENSRRRIRIELHSTELAQEINRRSSRDRIARGAIINTALISLFHQNIPYHLSIPGFLIAVGMWVYFEYASFSYMLDAELELSYK